MIKKKMFYVIIFLSLYGTLVIGGLMYDNYLDNKLKNFDLNNDGVFSPTEQTLEQQHYQFLVSNDISINLIPLSGLFVSFIATALVFVLSETYGYITKHRKQKNKPR